MKLFPHFIKATAAAAIVLDGTSASTFHSPREKLESQLQLPSLMKEKTSATVGKRSTAKNSKNLRHRFKKDDPSGWDQVGPDIQAAGMNGDGDDIALNFGFSVAMSDDAQTVAIGTPKTYNSNFEATMRGIVQVFEYGSSTGEWMKKGSDITGTDDYDFFGESLDMFAGSDAVVINSLVRDNFHSVVQVYKYASDWEQLGSDITGGLFYYGTGSPLALSADALSVIIGYPFANDLKGVVQVFSLDASSLTWNLVSSYEGVASYDYFGSSLDATSDASTIIVGAPGYNGNKGLVQAYQGDSVVLSIEGDNADDLMGSSVSLSEDASTVAILSHGFDNEKGEGLVQVYKNQELVGSFTGDLGEYIRSVKVSTNASTLTIFTIDYIKFFKQSSSNSWEQVGGNLMFYHDVPDLQNVPPVALSNDGDTIVKGFPEGTSANFDEAGFVRVYTLSQPPSIDSTSADSTSADSTSTDISEDTPTEDADDCGLGSIFSRFREYLKN